ncbi:hypothetical protein ECO26_p1-05 (plasmid) [Escherichia coli O26:H11 str. 11368]|nr:hypothetical protein ECO26_p1-05 [Escherichia coli O26:H11 str. 11368]
MEWIVLNYLIKLLSINNRMSNYIQHRNIFFYNVHMMINTILTPALTVASSESRSQGSGRCFLVKSTRYCFLVKFTLKKVVSENIRAGIPAFLCSLYNSVLVIRIFNISLLTMVYAIIHSLTLRAFSFKWDKKCFFIFNIC